MAEAYNNHKCPSNPRHLHVQQVAACGLRKACAYFMNTTFSGSMFILCQFQYQFITSNAPSAHTVLSSADVLGLQGASERFHNSGQEMY